MTHDLTSPTIPADSPFAPYVDEPIGMDHPLFMARMQAKMDAAMARDAGEPMGAVLARIRERMLDLFGEVPQQLVDDAVREAYARQPR